MNEMTARIAASLLAAQRAAKAVPKAATNSHQGYKYADAESIIDEGRTALNGAGLSMLVTDVKVDTSTSPPKIVSRILLAHESGDSYSYDREWFIIEQKGRPLDKGEGGALTSSLAYAIRDVLLLPRDDDAAAMDRRDDSAHDPDAGAVDATVLAIESMLLSATTEDQVNAARAMANDMRARMNKDHGARIVEALRVAKKNMSAQ